jgi:lipid II:glycine glycyltransferase (peptidoglycan interpeptide bridge formation enzyme)
MKAVRPLTPSDRAAWDALAEKHPSSGFMQTWAWSEFKELEGYDVQRLGLFDGAGPAARLVGGTMVYAFPSPVEARLAAMPDGPVLDWGAPGTEAAWSSLVRAVREGPAGKAAVALRVEPRLEELPAELASTVRAPVDLVPEETLEVALGPEAAMLAAMKPKGRYNARLAERRGVQVSTSTDPADVHEFHRVLEQTGRYHDFLVEPKSFFINLVRSHGPARARFAFASYKGITLAAALTVRHGATRTFLYGGHVPLFPEVMASYALHWHVMREAAAEGCRTYDLYGFVPAGRPDHPYDRFSRFKEKFGGRPVRRVGSRDLVFYDRLAEAAVGAMSAVLAEVR